MVQAPVLSLHFQPRVSASSKYYEEQSLASEREGRKPKRQGRTRETLVRLLDEKLARTRAKYSERAPWTHTISQCPSLRGQRRELASQERRPRQGQAWQLRQP